MIGGTRAGMAILFVAMLAIVTVAVAVVAYVSFPSNAPIHGPVRRQHWWDLER